MTQPTKEQIECRAYELYVERGAQPGQELADWLAAEQELMTQQELISITQPKSGPKVNGKLLPLA